MFLTVRFCFVLALSNAALNFVAAASCKDRMLSYEITQTWNGSPVSHDPIRLTLSGPVENGIKIDVRAPFFNDSDIPPGKPGEAVWKLWDYEVVEAFFLGDHNYYVEIEFSPYGNHIVLLLRGVHNAVNFCLPLDFKANIDGASMSWTGSAIIPASYFPTNVTKFNAYAIHGRDRTRTYLSLYPVPAGKYKNPDFHRLEYFGNIPFRDILPTNPEAELSELWNIKFKSSNHCGSKEEV